ncbi:alkaline phosphatase family protein [Compostimonas suwonensis]|uniref:alkaline phosphatase family protein n=1 Tax=Compostimonas suwonensis TaxID=1048394 RepID=UPI001FEB3BEF|nr:alkaline phosphatase family protein [Compostimonas suwonensis]
MLTSSLAAVTGRVNPLGLAAVDHVVVVVVDGLGDANLKARAGHARFLTNPAHRQRRLTSFPSTTAAGLATLTTGVSSGRHGLVGYSVRDLAGDRIVNQLNGWDAGMDPATWQRARTVFQDAADEGVPAFAIGAGKFAGSGFSRAVLRGAGYLPADTAESRFEAARTVVASNRRSLSYLYLPELDMAAHAHGWESDRWLTELERVDSALAAFVTGLPRRVGVLTTADHGIVDVPHSGHVLYDGDPALLEGVRHVGGEPRLLHLYLNGGAESSGIDGAGDDARTELAARWSDSESERSWVATRAEAIDAGWFGEVDGEVVDRIGDVLVAARKRVAYYDSRSPKPSARAMIGQHGSLTPEETRVPLVGMSAFAS